jgi:hypothetical protein
MFSLSEKSCSHTVVDLLIAISRFFTNAPSRDSHDSKADHLNFAVFHTLCHQTWVCFLSPFPQVVIQKLLTLCWSASHSRKNAVALLSAISLSFTTSPSRDSKAACSPDYQNFIRYKIQLPVQIQNFGLYNIFFPLVITGTEFYLSIL